MRDQCSFATFDCCNCSGECESAAVPIIHITEKNPAPLFLPCWRIGLAFVAFFAISAATFLTVNELRREARQHQIQARV